jgi:hypothetical protein
MTRTTVERSIKTFLLVELFIFASYFYSVTLFINVQVAFLSSFFIILGSALAYKKMVEAKRDSGEYESDRDLLDTIEDPHELYDDKPLNEAPAEELDLKAIVKEERAKIKTFSLSSMKHGVRASVSLFRLVPYLLLILGFVALKNNDVLELKFYLPALLVGIVTASILTKRLS